jgi:hypothetical protein
MNCPRCNAENADHARFCANCGQPLTPQTASLQPIQPVTSTPAPAPTVKATVTPPDVNTAFVLELVLGLIGFMGVGWMYGGHITVGAILLVGWWLAMAVGIGGSFITVGLGCCIWIPVQFVAPFISALILRNQLQSQNRFSSTFPK